MARIVKLHDQSPFVVTAEQLKGGPCAVCRCGLSAAWPLCDGTHKQTRDEDPGRLYAYTREGPTVQRATVDGVGDLEPLLEGEDTTLPAREGDVARSAAHAGDGAHRGRRPVPEQAPHASKGNEAGSEPEGGEGDATTGAQDELIEAGGSAGATALQPKTAHGGAEGLAPKNRSGQGGESA